MSLIGCIFGLVLLFGHVFNIFGIQNHLSVVTNIFPGNPTITVLAITVAVITAAIVTAVYVLIFKGHGFAQQFDGRPFEVQQCLPIHGRGEATYGNHPVGLPRDCKQLAIEARGTPYIAHLLVGVKVLVVEGPQIPIPVIEAAPAVDVLFVRLLYPAFIKEGPQGLWARISVLQI